ncbi:hypothetical protein QOT17_009889 [Balamuthia mandrillaris]
MEAELNVLDLPGELLSLILGFIETKALYPSFLVCNAFCEAALDEHVWRLRCKNDLGIDQADFHGNWCVTYKDALLSWDPSQATLPHKERVEYRLANGMKSVNDDSAREVITSGPGQNLFIDNANLRWMGSLFLSVRGKRSLHKGRTQVNFKITATGNSFMTIGLVEDSWDCRLHAWRPNAIKRNWCWTNRSLYSHSVDGNSNSSSEGRPHKKNLPEWSTGSFLSFIADFEARTIELYCDKVLCERCKMPADLERLWPVAALYDSGNAVSLVPTTCENQIPPSASSAVPVAEAGERYNQ